MKLRQYQQDCIDSILLYLMTEQRALASLSTGLGKSFIAASLIMQAQKLKPTLTAIVLINNVDLIRQTQKKYKEYGLDSTVYCASLGEKVISQTTIASIQSIYDKEIDADLIIVDESHAVSTDEDTRMHKFLATKKAKIVGFTATPYRSDGYIYGDNKFYKELCFEMGLKQAIKEGFLVRPILKHTKEQFDTSEISIQAGEFNQAEVKLITTDKDKSARQILDALPKITNRKKIAWACSCIEHAEIIHSMLSEIESACIVHSEREDRDEQLNQYHSTDTRHIVFVNVLKEGYDYPPIDAVIFLRPTRSPTLMVQIIGRGLRTHGDKSDCLVLDYGQVIMNCGAVDEPNVREKGERRKDLEDNEMKFCPACYTYINKNAGECSECGHVFQVIEREHGKTLSTQAQYGQILSDDPIEYEVFNTEFSMHLSKAGNKCVRIDYFTDAHKWPIAEFFTVIYPSGMRRLNKRLEQFGLTEDDFKKINHLSNEEKIGKLNEICKSLVNYLTAKKDGKHFRVHEVGKRDRERYIALSELEPNPGF